jgi:hypothetical protein
MRHGLCIAYKHYTLSISLNRIDINSYISRVLSITIEKEEMMVQERFYPMERTVEIKRTQAQAARPALFQVYSTRQMS